LTLPIASPPRCGNLRERADDRGDLLAEVACLFIGYYRRTGEELKAPAAAYYCIAFGVTLELILR